METRRASELAALYRDELLESVVPFWERRGVDRRHGGFFTCLDRDGTLYDDTKYVWLQGRAVWMFSRLYNQVEKRKAWLTAAERGQEFLREHCFDSSGRMYFAVNREGARATKPWAIFSECFTVMGLAEYARASGDGTCREEADALLKRTLKLTKKRDLDTLSYPEQTRLAVHAVPMILLNVAQEMRDADDDTRYDPLASEMMARILSLHCHPRRRAVLENVGPDGEFVDTPDGRVINPGHALESAWFVLREASRTGDAKAVNRAVRMIDWSLERGWDEEHGGLLYFLDYKGLPSPFLEWDMKLWWVHVEALYALLLAHRVTGDARMGEWFERLHRYTWDHFRDPEHGEWYGYLHRDGTPALSLKGSMWKGFYHLPRGLLLIWQLLEGMGCSDEGPGAA